MELFLVVLQIVLFFWLFLYANVYNLFTFIHLVILFASGFLLYCWSVISLGKKSFSFLPQLKKNGNLVVKGPYKLVRHPLYLGALLMGLAFILSRFSLLTCLIYAFYVWTTAIKTNLDEEYLEKKYKEYKNYKKNTPKYFPVSLVK